MECFENVSKLKKRCARRKWRQIFFLNMWLGVNMCFYRINDCNHNESDRNDKPPQNLETNSNVTKYDRVIKKPARFRDT